MAVQVAVVDPLPMFRRGVAAELSAVGFAVDDPPDVFTWARQTPAAVILLTIGAEGDWRLLDQLHSDDLQVAVIVLFDELDNATAARAIRAGASSVLSRNATAATLCRTVEATLDGQTVLPSGAAGALAAGGAVGADDPMTPSAQQLDWLRHLADGNTVARLASDAGYSERAIYRMLQVLYQQMGVAGRLQAIMQAQARGWLR